jgi:protein-tyrosine-phosphatase
VQASIRKQGHWFIWVLALGYFLFYTPYAALVRSLASSGGFANGVPLLPRTLLATVATLMAIVTMLGWWRYAMKPTLPLLVSGIGTALIIAATTLAYTFRGVSVILALLLMRGGVLVMAPIIDAALRRKVRWFSWAALLVSLSAVGVAIFFTKDRSITGLVVLNLSAYLTGYALRLLCMTWVGKVDDPVITRRYFVTEMLVACALLVAVPALIAVAAPGALRSGYLHAPQTTLAIGFFYACLYACLTLIYLDRRENTFTIPLFCGSSLLAGISAALILHRVAGLRAPSSGDLVGALLMLAALLLLSPFHHRLEDAWAFLRGRPLRAAAVPAANRLILFVCSGNTCRSPMAAAIANAELAARHGMPLDAVLRGRLRAESAGLTPRLGSPMTDASHTALGGLSITAPRHEARELAPELVAAADVIYTMTASQQQMLLERFPEAAPKVRCLDPEGDIPDPIGQADSVYVAVAQRMQMLVRMRLDEMRGV